MGIYDYGKDEEEETKADEPEEKLQ